MLDFPDAPAVDQIYTSPEGDYKWNGYGWRKVPPASVTGAYLPLAGGTMTGKLSFGSALGAAADDFSKHIAFYDGGTKYGINVTSNSFNYVITGDSTAHKFHIAGAEKFQVHNGGINVYGILHAHNGGRFQHNRIADGEWCLSTYAAWMRSAGGSNEGTFEIWSNQGGYSDSMCFRSLIGSPGGLYVNNQMSAGSIVDRGAASTKHDIRDCNDAEVTAAFAALKPKRFRKNNPPDSTKENAWPQPAPHLRYGFVVDDLVAEEATKDIAAMVYVPGSDGKEYEPQGTDVMQVLALTVAKLKQVEAELTTLQSKMKVITDLS